MKWTVQRYVLREVVQTWLGVTGVLVAILISNQLSARRPTTNMAGTWCSI
jgi:lipopolysaccharide export LptBFGC system permease protein LptF